MFLAISIASNEKVFLTSLTHCNLPCRRSFTKPAIHQTFAVTEREHETSRALGKNSFLSVFSDDDFGSVDSFCNRNGLLEERQVNEVWSWVVIVTSIGALAYADDVDLMGESLHEIDAKALEFVSEAGRVGLKVNEGKTKIVHARSEVNMMDREW